MVDDAELKGFINTSSESYFADFERLIDSGRKVDRRQRIALYRLKDVITSAADKAAVEATVEKFIAGYLTERDVLEGTIGLMVPEHREGRKNMAFDVNPILLVTNRITVMAFKKIKFTKSLWEQSPKWITDARPIIEIEILGVSDGFFKSQIDEVTEEGKLEIDTVRKILDYEEKKLSDRDIINVIRGFVSTMEDKKSEHWNKFIETRILATGDTTLKYIFLLCTAPDDLYIEFYRMVDMNPGILNSKVLVTIIAKIVEDGGKINKVVMELNKINAQKGRLTVEEIKEGLIYTFSERYFADFERMVDCGRKVDRRQRIALYRLKDVITSAADKAAVEATVEKLLAGYLTERDVLEGTIGLMVPEHHNGRNQGRTASDVNPILLVTNRITVMAFKKIKFTMSLWKQAPQWITDARPIIDIEILGVSERFFKSQTNKVSEEGKLEIETARKILDYEEKKLSDRDVINAIRGFVSTMEDKKSKHWNKFIETRILATGDTTLKYIFLLCTAPDDLYIEFYKMVDLNPGILNSKVLVTIIARIVETGGKINKVIEELKKINAQKGRLTVEKIRENLCSRYPQEGRCLRRRSF